MLKPVTEDVAFLYIVAGVYCGEDGETGPGGPRGGLKGAGGPGLPSVELIPTAGTGLRTPDTCRTIVCAGPARAVAMSLVTCSTAGDSDRSAGPLTDGGSESMI